MRKALSFGLTFLLGGIAATTINAYAGSGFVPVTDPKPFTGYSYDASKGRAEVKLDDFAPNCKGIAAKIIISADRNEAEIDCEIAHTGYDQKSQLPVFQANPEFAVIWTR